MKKVEAFIRHEAFEPIRNDLLKLGFPSLSISEVKGSGRQKGITERYRGASLTNWLRPKVKLECVVASGDVKIVVETILKHARTGSIGDGKVFVMPVEEAYRIRTGESGEETLQAHLGAATISPASRARTRSGGAVLRRELLALTLGALPGARDALGAAGGEADDEDDRGDGDERREDGEEDDHAPGTAHRPLRDRLLLAGAGLFAAHDLALGVHARGDGLVGDLHGEGAAGLGAGGEARLAVEAGRDAVGERVVAGLDGRELPLEGLGLAGLQRAERPRVRVRGGAALGLLVEDPDRPVGVGQARVVATSGRTR